MPLEPVEEKELDLAGKFGHFAGEKGEAAAPAEKSELPGARETVSAEKDAAYQQILSKVQGHPDASGQAGDVSGDAQSVSEKTDAESQIKHLVEIASQNGVVHAVKVAKHLENNYILDTFHDQLLSEELHAALVKKGLIREI